MAALSTCSNVAGTCFNGECRLASKPALASNWLGGWASCCTSNLVDTRLRRSVTAAAERGNAGLLVRASTPTTVGESELDVVSRFSEIVPDTVVGDDFDRFPPTAATVSFSLLVGVSSLPDSKFEGAIDSALAYGKCLLERSGDNRMACFTDKALVNVGAELLKVVPGRVSTEVDARLASDTSAIVDKVRTLIKLYQEVEVPLNRLLFKIPATWQGIEAARQLEDDGIPTHVTGIYSFAQAAAACAHAKASVIQISVGRLRDWARTHSGDSDIDAALKAGQDPGLELVKRAAELVSSGGGPAKTKVMAANVRSKEDVLGLLGVDYIVAPVKVLVALKESSSASGEKLERKIGGGSPLSASLGAEVATWDEAKFNSGIGPCADQLLAAELESAVAQSHRVEEFFAKIWPPPNV